MSILFAALGAGIVSYIAFVLMFPKAVPQDSNEYVRSALNRLYEENRASENEQVAILRDQLEDEAPFLRWIFRLSFMQPLYEIALQAGYHGNLQHIVTLMIGGFMAGFLGGMVLGHADIGLLVGILLTYAVPYRHCMKRVRTRNRQFIDQFPDALDMIVRSVRSGFPIAVALQMLAENSENPVREEFRQVVDEITMGRSLNQTLARLATRINEPDIRFFVVVLTVQQETGGNLAEVIGNLSSIIRKRKQLRHKIRAMTSEGRATGWVLGLLPVFMFGALYAVQPTYLRPFFHDPLGLIFLGTAAGLVLTCAFVVKQMVDVDI